MNNVFVYVNRHKKSVLSNTIYEQILEGRDLYTEGEFI